MSAVRRLYYTLRYPREAWALWRTYHRLLREKSKEGNTR